MRPRFLALARALLAAWAALFLMSYLLAPRLLGWLGPLLGITWVATIKLTLDCAVLAGSGWIAGRLGTLRAVLIFAASLLFWDFGDSLSLDVPGLARLAANSFRDSRYLDSLVTALATHALLFGSLFAGAWWSLPPTPPPSITHAEAP